VSIETLDQNAIERVEFCSLCNNVPATGRLTIKGFDGDNTTQIPACLECAQGLDWSEVDESQRPK